MKLHEESKRYIKAFEKAKLICGYYPELKLYDYSKVIYKHPQSKVIICCPEHGEFKGKLTETCPACTFNRKIKTFIRGGADRRGYDYSKVELKDNSKNTVTVTCPKHGDDNALKNPDNFLRKFIS